MVAVESTGQWFALRTYFAQEQKVGRYLEKCNLHFFIPMLYRYVAGHDGKPQPQARTAVHNLIFLERTIADEKLQEVLDNCPYAVRIYTKPDSRKWQEIPARDILDLRMICDSTFVVPRFISQQEAELNIGRMVRVAHGPLKGITGKLVRKNRKYYIVKSIADMGVMVTVSRWCCEEIREEEGNQ